MAKVTFSKDEYRIVDELNNFFNRGISRDDFEQVYGFFFDSGRPVHPLFVRLGRLLKVFVESQCHEGEDALRTELYRVEKLILPHGADFEVIRVCIDLDGVVVDYEQGTKTWKGQHGDREEGMFLSFPPIEGAIDAVQLLLGDPRFDVYFVSTAPWSNPSAWTDKRLWLEQHFGEGVKKRLVLTHRKDLVVGDVLIDDRPNNGASEFPGYWMHFGSEEVPHWKAVISLLCDCDLFIGPSGVKVSRVELLEECLKMAVAKQKNILPNEIQEAILEIRSSATSIPVNEMVSVPNADGGRFSFSRWDLKLGSSELMEFASGLGLSWSHARLNHPWRHKEFLSSAHSMLTDLELYHTGDSIGQGSVTPIWRPEMQKPRWKGCGLELFPSQTLTQHSVRFISKDEADVITRSGPPRCGRSEGIRVLKGTDGKWRVVRKLFSQHS